MGYSSLQARDHFLPTSIILHLLLAASIIIAMAAQWARVNFDVRDPAWTTDITGANTDTGIFSCPTNKWYIFAYNGFCSQNHLDDGSRGNSDDTDCITWNNEKHWIRMQNSVRSCCLSVWSCWSS